MKWGDDEQWEDVIPVRRLAAESELLSEEFYSRRAVDVGRDLLGKVLVFEAAAGRIVEVEAYLGVSDLAAHAAAGVTDRTRVLFGPPGRAYVYLIYGMYECLNLVAEPDGWAGCVLIRALEPLCGVAAMKARRPAAKRRRDLCSGPGKLTAAMGITRALNGANVSVPGGFTVRTPRDPLDFAIATGPRIGITKCADWPLRFWVEGNQFVSR